MATPQVTGQLLRDIFVATQLTDQALRPPTGDLLGVPEGSQVFLLEVSGVETLIQEKEPTNSQVMA